MDRDAFLLTTCYAAGKCQGDLGCPGTGTAWCVRVPARDDFDDDYDDEEW